VSACRQITGGAEARLVFVNMAYLNNMKGEHKQ
jgi:hypothetical protein